MHFILERSFLHGGKSSDVATVLSVLAQNEFSQTRQIGDVHSARVGSNGDLDADWLDILAADFALDLLWKSSSFQVDLNLSLWRCFISVWSMFKTFGKNLFGQTRFWMRVRSLIWTVNSIFEFFSIWNFPNNSRQLVFFYSFLQYYLSSCVRDPLIDGRIGNKYGASVTDWSGSDHLRSGQSVKDHVLLESTRLSSLRPKFRF